MDETTVCHPTVFGPAKTKQRGGLDRTCPKSAAIPSPKRASSLVQAQRSAWEKVSPEKAMPRTGVSVGPCEVDVSFDTNQFAGCRCKNPLRDPSAAGSGRPQIDLACLGIDHPFPGFVELFEDILDPHGCCFVSHQFEKIRWQVSHATRGRYSSLGDA